MDEFLKMDIFFTVATGAVLIVTLLVSLILYRLWKILRHVERFSEEVAAESSLIREDLSHLRNDIKGGVNKTIASFGFLRRLTTHSARRKRAKKEGTTNDNQQETA